MVCWWIGRDLEHCPVTTLRLVRSTFRSLLFKLGVSAEKLFCERQAQAPMEPPTIAELSMIDQQSKKLIF